MNIYTKNYKEVTDIMISFMKTIFGKITFLLSYSMFFIFLIQGLLSLILLGDKMAFAVFSFMSLIVFILGSINYYKELRIYSEKMQ